MFGRAVITLGIGPHSSVVYDCVVQCLKDTGIHQFRLLFILAVISGICFAPLWAMYDLSRILNDSSLVNASLCTVLPLVLGYVLPASITTCVRPQLTYLQIYEAPKPEWALSISRLDVVGHD